MTYETPGELGERSTELVGDLAGDLTGEMAIVHVVRGEPDDVELAALVAGLAAAGAEAGDDDPMSTHPHSAWTDRSRAMRGRAGPRTPIAPGADTWRWSLRS